MRISVESTRVAALMVISLLAGVACSSAETETRPPASPSPSTAQPPAEPGGPPKALYERLGGQPAIEAVVDEFLQRVAADKRINGRFINTDLPRLRGLLVQFVCVATGGPCKYEGRDMRSTHVGLELVDEEFGALVEDLTGALDKFKVGKREQGELLGALAGLKKDIVFPPSAAAAEHDPALVKLAESKVAELRKAGQVDAADLIERAVAARVRGQRSYAEQLFSAAEKALPEGGVPTLDPLFREGAPPRITTALKTLPADTAPQPKTAVGGSDEDQPDAKPQRSTLGGVLKVDGGSGGDLMGVIALDPVHGKSAKRTPKQRVIEQRDRQFAPRFLAIPVGSTVSFPNFDSVYHNVFSLSANKSFDLGIYKNGQTREVTFEKEGIVRIGCNLHSNMSAHIVVVAAPHYAVTDAAGHFHFRTLAPGKYKLRAWTEGTAEPVTQMVQVAPGDNNVAVRISHNAPEGPGPDKFGLPRGKAP